MTVFCKPVDNAASTLEAARSLGESTITLAAGSGDRFGTPTASDPIRVTLVRATALDFAGRITDPDRLAVFRCTERSGDTLSGLTLESGTDQFFHRRYWRSRSSRQRHWTTFTIRIRSRNRHPRRDGLRGHRRRGHRRHRRNPGRN
jgi:hypothetical protein